VELRQHRDHVTGAWKWISKPKPRVGVSYDSIMVTALRHCTWMDEDFFQKNCINEEKQRGGIIHQPFYGTRVADFMLRQGAGKFMLGKYLSNKQIPWKRRRRFGMAVAGIMTTTSQLGKIGKMQSIGCQVCRIGQEVRCESTDGLMVETYSHVNRAGCKRMATAITSAHHSISILLYVSLRAAKKPKSKHKLVTLDKESNISTLWRREKIFRICCEEHLAEKLT